MGRSPTPRVLIAPDKFRGSLTASEAADAIATGILRAVPAAQVIRRPLSDGGEGMIDALVGSGAQPHPLRARGPLGREIVARFATLGGTAYIESAQMCGLDLLVPTPDSALRANSAGLGDAIRAVAACDVARIVVGLGGSATTDGGAGALLALGFAFEDRDGQPVELLALERIWRIRAPANRAIRAGVAITVATDVDSPLVGEAGAARLFSPQKGADAATVALLERRLELWSDALERSFGRPVARLPGGGAAGGIAAGLSAALDATIVSGSTLMLDLLDVPADIARADLVITGEGALDRQSLQGKLPVRIAQRARAAHVPVWAIAGRVEGGDLLFDRIAEIVTAAGAARDPFRDAAEIVAELAAALATEWRAAGPVARDG
ncbi:glycerate kinase family protein [Sphingomonas glacialis]|uniref:Glycerate kinase n=1 Tax=Sphingomonas glacialis TaxID=658225 RepID=A0A502G3H4_9SPHN|nr:glycerate kinase [Sphingomonas glacialis]TPG56399.1 glycerate kinase [Sphingomonas glacialis]